MTKVHKPQGGDRLHVEPGGVLKIGDTVFTADDDGNVIVTGLPVADPQVLGALWADSGVLTVSAGG